MDKKANINDFNLDGLAEGVALAKKRPGANKARKTCRVEWRRGVKFETFIRQHSFNRRRAGQARRRGRVPQLHGVRSRSLRGLPRSRIRDQCEQEGHRIRGVSVELESTQDNALTFLGLATDGHPGFDRIEAKLKVRSKADPDAIQALWELTVRTSPVHNTLAEAVTLEATVELDP